MDKEKVLTVVEQIEYLDNAKKRCLFSVENSITIAQLDSIARRYISHGRTVLCNALILMRSLSPEDRVVLGEKLNEFKKDINTALKARQKELEEDMGKKELEEEVEVDLSDLEKLWDKEKKVDFAGCDEGSGQIDSVSDEDFQLIKSLPTTTLEIVEKEKVERENFLKMAEKKILKDLLKKDKPTFFKVAHLPFEAVLEYLEDDRKALYNSISSCMSGEPIKDIQKMKEDAKLAEEYEPPTQPDTSPEVKDPVECKSGIRRVHFDRTSESINARLIRENSNQKHYIRDLVNKISGIKSFNYIDKADQLIDKIIHEYFSDKPNSIGNYYPAREPGDCSSGGMSNADLRLLEFKLNIIDARKFLGNMGLIKLLRAVAFLSRPAVKLIKNSKLTNNKTVKKAINLVEAIKLIV